MKRRKPDYLICLISVFLTAFVILIPVLTWSGSLEPSAAPTSTMKTLDEAEPRIPIPGSDTEVSAYIITRSGSYYLTGDRPCKETGVQVDADNVSIDLMGYSLIGPSKETYNGINMDGRSNVEIRNGTIRGFYNGIYDGHSFSNGHRILGVRIIANRLSGIYLNGHGNLVKDCSVIENGASASSQVFGIFARQDSTVANNVVYRNGSSSSQMVHGIYVYSGCTVANNTVRYNGLYATFHVYGIWTWEDNLVTGNSCNSNGQSVTSNAYGIYCGNGNVVTNNISNSNGASGSGTGIGIFLTGNSLVDQNTAYNNDDTNMNACATCTFGTNHAP